MLRWILMVKKLFTTPLTLVDYVRLFRAWRERATVHQTRNTVKLSLEGLEKRVVPSVSTGNGLAAEAVASPPAVQQMASILSNAASTLDQQIQQIATAEQNLLASAITLGQEFAQIVYYVGQNWGRFLGLNLNASTPSLGTTKQQPSSGSGSGSGANSGHSTPVDATPPAHSPTIGLTTKKSGSGIGAMSDPSSGGTATVSGFVWLDNDGDNSFDDGELGFSDITVELWSVGVQNGLVASTTTDANGNYQIQGFFVPPAGGQYEVEVLFPSGDETTTEGSLCQVAPDDFSEVFFLAPGGAANIDAGANSMHVTTNEDDANGVIQNKITLRDAIKAGNKGDGPQVDFSPGVTGTISLQEKLDDIETSYNIVGPGSTTLAVQGGLLVNTPFRIFTVDAGVTSTIRGLTIEDGFLQNGDGAGISNKGNLTLNNDHIYQNQTTK